MRLTSFIRSKVPRRMVAIQTITLVACLPTMVQASPTATGFFHTQGTQIIDPQGNPYIAKGIAVSNWLTVEAYALGIDAFDDRHLNSDSDLENNLLRLLLGNSEALDAFWQEYRNNYVTEQDIQTFKNWGFNSVRIPFNYRLLSPQDEPDVYLEEGFAWMDKLIGWCKDAGMSVLLDMHACPGGQNHEPHSDPEYSYWDQNESGKYVERGVQVLLEQNDDYTFRTGRTREFNKARTASVWKKIAERYKDEPAIIGYELVNEPYYYYSTDVTDESLRELFIQIVSAVREVDINHIVYVSGNIFSEMIDGLLPPFDSNMGIGFHRYWRETGYADGKVQEYLDARETHQVPFLLTETGENSNTWFYEVSQLMTGLDIGWYFWGFKKIPKTAQAYEISISEDYAYVIEHWREMDDFDAERIQRGLMDLAQAVKTENCRYEPGYFESLHDPMFNVESKPYDPENVLQIPGRIPAVHYDVGNQGVAYSDTRYKNEEYQGVGWNLGWVYRNDGVDIQRSNGTADVDVYVFETEVGEWMYYTVDVVESGCYLARFQVLSGNGGALQLMGLTGEIPIPGNDDNDNTWQVVSHDNNVWFDQGRTKLKLRFGTSGVDIAWMEFEFVACDDYDNDIDNSNDENSPAQENPIEEQEEIDEEQELEHPDEQVDDSFDLDGGREGEPSSATTLWNVRAASACLLMVGLLGLWTL